LLTKVPPTKKRTGQHYAYTKNFYEYLSLLQSCAARHIRQSNLYWFCLNCRQDMPSMISTAKAALSETTRLEGATEENTRFTGRA